MAGIKVINQFGTMVGWTKVSARIMGRDLVGIRKIQYGDSVDRENQYGSGGEVIGRSEGNYEANASMELTIEEKMALQASLPKGSRIQDIPSFPVTVAFDFGGKVYKDVIHNCQFTDTGVDVKQGDKTIAHDYKLIVSHISYNM